MCLFFCHTKFTLNIFFYKKQIFFKNKDTMILSFIISCRIFYDLVFLAEIILLK